MLIASLFPDTPRAANVLLGCSTEFSQQKSFSPLSHLLLPAVHKLDRAIADHKEMVLEALRMRRVLIRTVQALARTSLVPKFVEEELLPLLLQSLEVRVSVSTISHESLTICAP